MNSEFRTFEMKKEKEKKKRKGTRHAFQILNQTSQTPSPFNTKQKPPTTTEKKKKKEEMKNISPTVLQHASFFQHKKSTQLLNVTITETETRLTRASRPSNLPHKTRVYGFEQLSPLKKRGSPRKVTI